VTECHSAGRLDAFSSVGGLVGYNQGEVTSCHSATALTGESNIGGLVGLNEARVVQCYSTGALNTAGWWVGGLVAWNYDRAVTHATVTQCYSTGPVSGVSYVGGLVGTSYAGSTGQSFWDTGTSGQATSDGGTGKTTAEMQTAATFLDAGWDFVGEIVNGAEDLWWIDEGKDYPRLWWETAPAEIRNKFE
jgi:hypothetical protein